MNSFKDVVKEYKEKTKKGKEIDNELMDDYLALVKSSTFQALITFYKAEKNIAYDLFATLNDRVRYYDFDQKHKEHLMAMHCLFFNKASLCYKLLDESACLKQADVLCELLVDFKQLSLKRSWQKHLYYFLVCQAMQCIADEPDVKNQSLIADHLIESVSKKLNQNDVRKVLQHYAQVDAVTRNMFGVPYRNLAKKWSIPKKAIIRNANQFYRNSKAVTECPESNKISHSLNNTR